MVVSFVCVIINRMLKRVKIKVMLFECFFLMNSFLCLVSLLFIVLNWFGGEFFVLFFSVLYFLSFLFNFISGILGFFFVEFILEIVYYYCIILLN